MNWDQAKDLILGFLGTSFCLVFVHYLNKLQSCFEKLQGSVSELNEKLAVLISTTASHERRIERLEDRAE